MRTRGVLLVAMAFAGALRSAGAQPVVSPERLVLGSPNSPVPACGPAAAWTGSHHILVWTTRRNQVLAAALDAGGTPVRLRVLATYSASTFSCPRIAGASGSSLAVWRDDRSAIVGARLDPATLSGAVFPIVFVAGRTETHPDVLFDPAFSSYLVAWQSQSSGGPWDIRARRVHSTGALVGPEVVVADARNSQLKPRLAGRPGLSLVTWEDYRDDALTPPRFAHIYGQLLAGDASLLGENFRISEDDTGFSAWNSTATYGASRFLVSWHQGDPGGVGRLLASYVSEFGDVDTPRGFLVSDHAVASSGEWPANAYDAASNRFFFGWRPLDGGGLMPMIRGTVIEGGTTSSTSFWIDGPSARRYGLLVGASAGLDRTFLVAYFRDTPAPSFWIPYLYRRFVAIP
jgi:hypothetical protein